MRTTLVLPVIVALAVGLPPARAEPTHGLAMHGEPALPANFPHLPYVDPDAPKGGSLRYGVQGTYDSLNPFILKSMRTSARGLWDPIYDNLTIESLMKRSRDEPFTLYGLLAEKVDVSDDRRSIEFFLHPDARFSDGEPVEPSDVMFTFRLLGEKGRPPFSSRMKLVERMEQTGPRSVKLDFNDGATRETPLLFGLMPILAEHATNAATFDQSSLKPPIGSGPYTIGTVDPGRSITYERDPDYWARDLPIARGHFNFDEVRVDYYRNDAAQFEAFKKGLFDLYVETSPAKWRTAYDFPAARRGDVVLETFEPAIPSGMLGLAFNTRRPVFANPRVREALAMLFDFEWSNRNLLGGLYERTTSYWQGSELSSLDNPADERERALLEPFADAVPAAIMDGSYRAPASDGSGRDRAAARKALSVLRDEGFVLEDGTLRGPDGRPLVFELLIAGGAGMSGQEIERLVLGYQRSAARIGVRVDIRRAEDNEYQERKTNYEYDMIVARYTGSLSPGDEQIFRWGSQARDLPGTFNFAGAASPAIDAVLKAMGDARSREDFRSAVRALDRLLIAGHYVVPLYHTTKMFVAHSARLARPERTPLYGPWYATWWSKDAR